MAEQGEEERGGARMLGMSTRTVDRWADEARSVRVMSLRRPDPIWAEVGPGADEKGARRAKGASPDE